MFHDTKAVKHRQTFKTNKDWRESGEEDDRDTLSVYSDEQEERPNVRVQIAMREDTSGRIGRSILPEMQKDVHVRDGE